MTKYLINPGTGSVDTEENWLADMPTWEGDQQTQFDALIEGVTWNLFCRIWSIRWLRIPQCVLGSHRLTYLSRKQSWQVA